ncbi:MAG: hypothetical protein E6Q34_11330 [Burkholderiaceae bacterium]|nr:MAG: hypothetical protein E6Q34_11330 [Burkholderiaceae bacterium]
MNFDTFVGNSPATLNSIRARNFVGSRISQQTKTSQNMKRRIQKSELILLLLAFNFTHPTTPTFAQNLFNPYKVTSPVVSKSSIEFAKFPWDDFVRGVKSSPNYDGELQVSLLNHPWGLNSEFGGYGYFKRNQDQTAKSVIYELVSFPFDVPESWDKATNKSPSPNTLPLSSNSIRVLAMPSSAYDAKENGWKYINSNTGAWQVLRRETNPSPFLGSSTGKNDAFAHSMDTYKNALVSAKFESKWGGAKNDTPDDPACYDPTNAKLCGVRRLLPHSILKITIRLHAGSSISSPVVSSFSWVYDMTRGRMSNYPFINMNFQGSANAATHDVVFVPQWLYKPDHSYNENTSLLGRDKKNRNLSLDYTPWGSTFPTGVTLLSKLNKEYPFWKGYLPPAMTTHDLFYSTAENGSSDLPRPDSMGEIDQTVQYNFPFAPPHSLVTSILRNGSGTVLAGYSDTNNAIPKLVTQISYPPLMTGIPHAYYLDRNVNLKLIGEVIYNPSAAKITANDFIFPSCTSFITIRGIYPTENEAMSANIPANGGPYDQLTSVPVPTDVSPTSDSRDASIYTIEAGGKLTIQNNVKLFDLSIYVRPGGTLIFSPDAVVGRYKVINQGGVVITQKGTWSPSICGWTQRSQRDIPSTE